VTRGIEDIALWAAVIVLASGLLGVAIAREVGPTADARRVGALAATPSLCGVERGCPAGGVARGGAIAARHSRAVPSATALAVGAATKLFPAVAQSALARHTIPTCPR